MRSKALVRFLNRVARFDDDIELIDVFVRTIAAGDLTPDGDGRLFDHTEPTEHPRLAKAKATDHNRGLVVGHLRKTVYSSYIKDLYEDFTEYLNELVVSAFRKGLDPAQLRGEYKVLLAADELLACEDWDAALQVIAGSVGNRLDAMGNHKKLDFLGNRLGLTINSDLIDAAMPFIELRHLLVHMDGKADEGFCSRCEGLGARPGESVRLTEQTTRDARAAVTALVEHIDARAIDVGILQEEDQQ